MKSVSTLLEDVAIPEFIKVRQKFDSSFIDVPEAELHRRLQEFSELSRIRPGMRVAIAVGSRGIANLASLVKVVADAVKGKGAHPFIVPAMGSHGGATAQGQAQVLARLGIDEQTIGAPVRSSMEVVKLGELGNGLPVYFDQIAYESDGIIVINRIKPHTAFSGPIESGLLKMIAVGLGNHKGAETCHQLGFPLMSKRVLAMARVIVEKAPLLFGLGLIENAYDQTCHMELLAPEEIEAKEKELLKLAKSRTANILFERYDVLITDFIGKNISGAGMDTNAIGRPQKVNKIVALDLTKESNGNATGVGLADFTTQRLIDQTDWDITYANGITSTSVEAIKAAVTLANDKDAIRAAIKTSQTADLAHCKIIRIRDTKHLEELEISRALLDEALANSRIEIRSEPYELAFDNSGFLKKIY